jgi:hypothetical protein
MSVVTNSRRLLTPEQIEGLATDHATARAADDLVRGDRWGPAGWTAGAAPNARLLWAEFPEARRSPTLTTVSLPGMRATCSCAAARFPCRHVIALLMRDLDSPFDFVPQPPAWAAAIRERAGDSQPLGSAIDPDRREATVIAGMGDLRLWLGDLAREGLAGLPKRGRGAWQGAANRLEDAYASEVARELRELSAIPGSGTDWPERLLPRLGRLALLCEAFSRLDDLSTGQRADALAAAGYIPQRTGEHVVDEWWVLGRVIHIENRAIRTRIWLRGRATGRWARIDGACAGGRLEGIVWPTSAVVAGELAFSPSAYPLLARPASAGIIPADGPGMILEQTRVDAALRDYSAALAANPWLRRYPLMLHEVFVEPPGAAGGRWRLRDREGRLLALPPPFGHGWRLLALAANRPLSLFGEWDGKVFVPASYFDGIWRGISSWRAVA